MCVCVCVCVLCVCARVGEVRPPWVKRIGGGAREYAWLFGAGSTGRCWCIRVCQCVSMGMRLLLCDKQAPHVSVFCPGRWGSSARKRWREY